MKNKKKTVTIIAIIGIGLAIIGGIGFYTCYHTWNAATCTRPRTCSICGKTEGESKGHTWSNATCTKPQTCTVCKQTKGKALGHDSDSWTTIKEAICNEAGEKEATCKRCGKSLTQEIPKTDHTPGEWKVTADYKINRDGTVIPGTQAIQCTVCNKELKTKSFLFYFETEHVFFANTFFETQKKTRNFLLIFSCFYILFFFFLILFFPKTLLRNTKNPLLSSYISNIYSSLTSTSFFAIKIYQYDTPILNNLTPFKPVIIPIVMLLFTICPLFYRITCHILSSFI